VSVRGRNIGTRGTPATRQGRVPRVPGHRRSHAPTPNAVGTVSHDEFDGSLPTGGPLPRPGGQGLSDSLQQAATGKPGRRGWPSDSDRGVRRQDRARPAPYAETCNPAGPSHQPGQMVRLKASYAVVYHDREVRQELVGRCGLSHRRVAVGAWGVAVQTQTYWKEIL
jgi:hypothetical protein